jgi:hypothetical protein
MTAGHCVDSEEPITIIGKCNKWDCVRPATEGEPVRVNGREEYNIINPNWGGWLILNQSCIPGDSGGSVKGNDDCLLGIPVENHSGQCYARISIESDYEKNTVKFTPSKL